MNAPADDHAAHNGRVAPGLPPSVKLGPTDAATLVSQSLAEEANKLHLDQLLDQALDASFPASDPSSVGRSS
jgi:hypothetical protein